MKEIHNQCHINLDGEFFVDKINHPYRLLSNNQIRLMFNEALENTPFQIKRCNKTKQYYLTRNGKKIADVEFTYTNSAGKTNYRVMSIPFSKKSFLKRLKDEETDTLIISPYSMFSKNEDGTYTVSNDVFLIANKTDIYKSQLGQNVKAFELANINDAKFSSGTRWFPIKRVRKSMLENTIEQNTNKNLSCVPFNKLKKYIEDFYSNHCAKVDEKANNQNNHFGMKKGIDNERKYFSFLHSNPNFIEIANRQYCNNDSRIVSVSHTGGNQTRSNLGREITQKADIVMKDNLNNEKKVSLKMTKNAYLSSHKPTKWLESMQNIFGITIPEDVKKTIYLFFGAPNTPEYNEIIQRFATQTKEIEKNRLFERHLREYDNDAVERMLEWFDEFQTKIFDFSAIRGNMANEADFITHIAFVNAFKLEEHNKGYLNVVIPTNTLLEELSETTVSCKFNRVGTQIWLPWGSIENHAGNMFVKIKFNSICKAVSHNYENDVFNGQSLVLA